MKIVHSVAIIGTGNVAFHLGNALYENGIIIDAVFGRNQERVNELVNKWHSEPCTDLSTLKTEMAIVCVSDDAISTVISQIPADIPIAYTSGSVEIRNLPQREFLGVLYPLQSFSRDRQVNMFEVPFLIESNKNPVYSQILFELAWTISRKVSYASSHVRKKYHLAAVWANNFTNHLMYQAKNYLDKEQLKWEYLLPLLEETVAKLKTMEPFEAQTGPARRNDTHIIEKQLSMQEGLPREIYALLSKSILETYYPEQKDHDQL